MDTWLVYIIHKLTAYNNVHLMDITTLDNLYYLSNNFFCIMTFNSPNPLDKHIIRNHFSHYCFR